jgi:hypothetical protein
MLSTLSQEILSSISPSNSTILRQLCNVPVGRWDLQQSGFRTIPGCPCPTETLRLYQKDKPSLGKGSEPAPVAVVQNSLNQSSAKLQDIRSICISGCAWAIFSRGHLCPPLQHATDPRLDLWNRLHPSPVSSGRSEEQCERFQSLMRRPGCARARKLDETYHTVNRRHGDLPCWFHKGYGRQMKWRFRDSEVPSGKRKTERNWIYTPFFTTGGCFAYCQCQRMILTHPMYMKMQNCTHSRTKTRNQ